MSFVPRFNITNNITAALVKIERTRGFLEAARLSDQWIAKMQAKSFILEAHYTTHIEGTHLNPTCPLHPMLRLKETTNLTYPTTRQGKILGFVAGYTISAVS